VLWGTLASQASRALAAVSRDDALWKPLGHPSWADHHALRSVGSFYSHTSVVLTGTGCREGSAWKGAYMLWLRAAVSQFRHVNTRDSRHATRDTRHTQRGLPTPLGNATPTLSHAIQQQLAYTLPKCSCKGTCTFPQPCGGEWLVMCVCVCVC
jgi:hypothetical protein